MTAPFPMTMFAGVSPIWQTNFLGATSLPAGLTYTGASNKFLYDSFGYLTTAPNNLLLNTATLSTQNVGTLAANYLISFYGTGSVTLSGSKSATINGTGAGNQVYLAFTATAGTLTVTVSGSVTNAVLSMVTYETTPRAGDSVVTSGTAYYGPAQDYQYNGSSWVAVGFRSEASTSGNYCATSNNFQGAFWTLAAGTLSHNLTGPDNVTNSGWTYTDSTSNTGQQFYTQMNPANGDVAISVFLKAGTLRYVQFGVDTGSNSAWTTVDTTNWTFTTGTGGSGSITTSPSATAVANGWYRCAMVVNITGTKYFKIAGTTTSSGAFVPSYIGTNKTVGVYGFQIDQGSVVFSYLNNASTSTPAPSRAADAFNVPSYASNAAIWQQKAISTGTVSRTYYAPSALPEPFSTGYWYQSMAAYPRALTTAEQTPRLVVGAPY